MSTVEDPVIQQIDALLAACDFFSSRIDDAKQEIMESFSDEENMFEEENEDWFDKTKQEDKRKKCEALIKIKRILDAHPQPGNKYKKYVYGQFETGFFHFCDNEIAETVSYDIADVCNVMRGDTGEEEFLPNDSRYIRARGLLEDAYKLGLCKIETFLRELGYLVENDSLECAQVVKKIRDDFEKMKQLAPQSPAVPIELHVQ